MLRLFKLNSLTTTNRSLFNSTSRLISSTSFNLLPSKSTTTTTTTTPSKLTTTKGSTGTGKGGKADKAAAIKAKEKAKLLKLRESAKALKLKLAEKEKAIKAKAKAKAKAKKVIKKVVIAAKKVKKPTVKVVKIKKPKTTLILKAPRVPSNTWQLFLSDYIISQKAALAEGVQSPAVVVLAKQAAPLYRDLSEEAKRTLTSRHQAEKDAYPAVYATWLASLTPDMIKEENTIRFRRRKLGLGHKKNLRAEGEPKRPVSGYFRYCSAVRAGEVSSGLLDGESNVLKQATRMADSWRSLPEEQRKVYNDQCAIDRVRYLEEKKAFDAANASV